MGQINPSRLLTTDDFLLMDSSRKAYHVRAQLMSSQLTFTHCTEEAGIVETLVCLVFYDSVPPNATVIFEIELYTVTRGPRSVESFREIDLDRDRSLSKSEVREYMKKEFETRGSKRDASFYDAIVADVFRKSDHNGDGLISAKEYNVYDHDEL